MIIHYHYRPQRSCEGYVFTGMCLSTGGNAWSGTPPDQVHLPPDQVHPPGTRYPPTRYNPLQTRYTPWDQVTPPDQVHPPRPGTPPDQVHTPWTRYTPPWTRYTPSDQVTPLDQVHPPPRYGHCCGRYASYWNAFLCLYLFTDAMIMLKSRYLSCYE